MPKDDSVYVGHMLDTARRALRLVAGKSRGDYEPMKRFGWPPLGWSR